MQFMPRAASIEVYYVVLRHFVESPLPIQAVRDLINLGLISVACRIENQTELNRSFILKLIFVLLW